MIRISIIIQYQPSEIKRDFVNFIAIESNNGRHAQRPLRISNKRIELFLPAYHQRNRKYSGGKY